jgi:hypothetical protein
MVSRRVNVDVGDETETALHQLFQTDKIKEQLRLHYTQIADNYSTIIKDSPYGIPPVEIFCGLISDAFINSVTGLLWGLKSSVLYNITASEDEGLTYREIAQNVTDLMVEYEKELKRAEDIEMYKRMYKEQAKALRKAGII